jgi:hypothetical protein
VAVAVLVRLPGARLDQYDAVVARCGLDDDPAVGQILHLCIETPTDVELVEVWQTRKAALAFVETRLKAAMRLAGIVAEPNVWVFGLHNLFAADIETIERIGSVSTPAGSRSALD